MTAQPTLFDPPPEPPTGPQTDVRKFTGEAGGYRGYAWWKQTEDGRRVFAYIERIALTAAARGDTRISTKNLVERAREYLQLEVNNSHTAALADDLVARHPHLEELIERRKRRKVCV